VGATPSRTELPRNHCERMKAFKDADKPLSLCPPEKDPKWRFFWRMGERPPATAFEQLNAAPVVPAAIPEWPTVMDAWGTKLLDASVSVAELAAIGFGLPADTFASRMRFGPHLLAPTASDFSRFGALGTVLAGYHYDLNFITTHGRSRYPGLYVWTREGSKRVVKIPAGCLLVQAGKQAEHLTGGHVLAGFHEVVVTPATVTAIASASAAGRSLWRISSTLFSHIASDVTLQPLGDFATPEALAAYPPMFTGDHVKAELDAINLGAGSDGVSAAY
jgi:isopenicillin N synthase-like dioxygenase